MLRGDVEKTLTAQGVNFFKRSGDTLIALGHEPSGVWYCWPFLVSVLVSYHSSDRDLTGMPNDVVHTVTLDHWDNCL